MICIKLATTSTFYRIKDSMALDRPCVALLRSNGKKQKAEFGVRLRIGKCSYFCCTEPS